MFVNLTPATELQKHCYFSSFHARVSSIRPNITFYKYIMVSLSFVGNVSLCSSTLSPFSSTSITVSSLPQATSTPSQEPRPSRYSDPTFRFKPDLPNVFLRLVKTHRRNFSTVSVQGMKKWDNLAQVQSLIRLKYSYALGQSFLLGYMVGNTNVELQSSEDLPGMYLQHEQKNLLTLWAQPANQGNSKCFT